MARTEALRVAPGILIPADEILIEYTRSGGPGGQNVNKVETCAVLRFSPASSRALDAGQKERILERLASRLTGSGELLLRSSEHSSRQQNTEAGLARLSNLLAEAVRPRKRRRATKPTKGSQRRRLESKRQNTTKKQARRSVEE